MTGGVPLNGDIAADAAALQRGGGRGLISASRPGAPGAQVLWAAAGGLDPTQVTEAWRGGASARQPLSGVRRVGELPRAPTGDDIPALGLTEKITYRAVEVHVSSAWYQRWRQEWSELAGTDEGGELVSSTKDCLRGVWPELTAAIELLDGLRSSNLDQVIGCYSLLDVGERSLFWRADPGSHRRALYYIMRMIVVFGDAIQDEFRPTSRYARYADRCDGFSDFCRRVLRNQKAHDATGTFCQLRMHVDCTDERFQDTTAQMPCDDDDHEPWTRNCGRYYDRAAEAKGRVFDDEWDAWEGEDAWDPSYRVYRAANGSAARPRLDAGTVGVGSGWVLTIHPIHLAWIGFVCDRILHRARIAWDYYRYTGDETVAKRARELGRYALSVLAPLGQIIIHEIGHTYMGQGGHCEFGCCFDIGSVAWQCAVRAKLGLPPGEFDSGNMDFRPGSGDGAYRQERWEQDFGGARTIISATDDSCSSCNGIARGRYWYRNGAEGSGHLSWTCDIVEGGRPRSDSQLCLNRAWGHYWVQAGPSYIDEWEFTGCRPWVAGDLEWYQRRFDVGESTANGHPRLVTQVVRRSRGGGHAP